MSRVSTATPTLDAPGPIFLVDVVQVAPGDAPAYLRLLHELAIPVMTSAGAVFESCRSTACDLGLDVDIEIVWRFADFATWNLIRRDLVQDPAWYQLSTRAAALRRSGTRRFMQHAAGPSER